ncbi:hypothetical protein ERD78_17745 [Allopusillimonas soli]|uniref:YqjK-like protein n=1 Tax=Allopusillimonas soli TaxID=659016 RepID=A0A853FF05_9BURK|nr:hypothetical protein [Allopusillimonas soli]NYT38487.1 hypothetical protein [Allopusillimonas soli]TEA71790.1 hypothetical protein ERD78_17745 [Allopusillimonas soli]
MTQAGMSARERAVRIELARARAALERQAVARSTNELAASLTPRALLHSAFPRATSKSPTDLLFQALRLTRRYPLLTSSASALVSGVLGRKRRWWWRLGAGLLLSWQVARSMDRKSD